MYLTAQIPEINNLNLLSHILKHDELLTYTLNKNMPSDKIYN